jgi:hypothetical protein
MSLIESKQQDRPDNILLEDSNKNIQINNKNYVTSTSSTANSQRKKNNS